jgi:hypothetical protein
LVCHQLSYKIHSFATETSYIIESDVAPLCQAVLVLAALAILIDLDLYT